jgi:glucuronate isomerase
VSSTFISDNFLLATPHAERLYHDFAAPQPIIDYHTHLPVREIAENRAFRDLAEVWLEADHYKWRAMRANGIPESHITGSASPPEKYRAWAKTVPNVLGNPLYHWTHLELRRYFDVDTLLSADTAEEIWDICGERLRDLTARDMLGKMNVEVVCTTDDPADSLEYHAVIAADGSIPIQVLPTWRPDAALHVDAPDEFNAWLDRLGDASGTKIESFDDFWAALTMRHQAFHDAGCRLSDHGIETFYAEPTTLDEAAKVFRRTRSRERIDAAAVTRYRSALLDAFARMDAAKGWIQQFHVGPLRNNNPLLLRNVGRDAGADSIGDEPFARSMNAFFARLDTDGQLAKTIVYNINPADNAMVISTLGNFEDGSVRGKMQFGTAWWFNDHIEGMENHLTLLARMGVLSRFIGMLTDSRSFLSFPRHEYFRRILCNFLGREMNLGRIPDDIELVGGMVADICHRNAVSYFGFNK